jgi:hypothetical protein
MVSHRCSFYLSSLYAYLGNFPEVDVETLLPAMTGNRKLAGGHLKDFCPIVMLKAVVQFVAQPGPPLRIGLLIHKQVALAAIPVERIMFATDNLDLFAYMSTDKKVEKMVDLLISFSRLSPAFQIYKQVGGRYSGASS